MGTGTPAAGRSWLAMAKPDAASIAKVLRELGQRIELEGGNPYRARAYGRAAQEEPAWVSPPSAMGASPTAVGLARPECLRLRARKHTLR